MNIRKTSVVKALEKFETKTMWESSDAYFHIYPTYRVVTRRYGPFPEHYTEIVLKTSDGIRYKKDVDPENIEEELWELNQKSKLFKILNEDEILELLKQKKSTADEN